MPQLAFASATRTGERRAQTIGASRQVADFPLGTHSDEGGKVDLVINDANTSYHPILSRKLLLLPAVRWSGSDYSPAAPWFCSLDESPIEPQPLRDLRPPPAISRRARRDVGPERGVGAQAQRMCVRRRGSCAESKAPDGTRALRSVSFVGGPRRNRRHESGGCSGHAPAAARLVFVPETSAGALRPVVVRSKHPCPRLLGVSAALSGAVLFGAFVLFKRLDKYFADVI